MVVVRISPLLSVVPALAAVLAAGPMAGSAGDGGRSPDHRATPALVMHARTASPDTQLAEGRAALKAAREAQRTFERIRRRHLPFWNGPTGRCDEVVGRFCLWHDGDPAWDPGPERPRVTAAREDLVRLLEEYARAAPGDWWVVGQWIRYLVEAGRSGEAVAAAGTCAAERWWCLALTGYALHASGDFSGAEASYGRALPAMPAEESCRWNDLSYLLEGDALDEYEDLDCAERAAMEARIWWLADPLIMVPGNERRTEHFSRHVLNRLQVGTDSPYGVAWGSDLEELLIRYGWPTRWSRRREPVYTPGRTRPSITGHDPEASFRFFPPPEVLAEFTTLEAGWDLEPRRPREEYLPSYAAAFDSEEAGFDHQLAVFRRGGSALLVGAYEWTSDSLPSGTPLRVGLVYSGERGRPEVAVSEGAPRRGVLTTRTRTDPGLLGIEAMAGSARRAARVRAGRRLAAADRPSLSDIVLLEPAAGEGTPRTLEEALPFVRSSTAVRSGDRIGLLWETYGVDESTPLEVAVSLSKPDKGFLRRAAEWLGLAKEEVPTVGLQWHEARGVGPEPAARYVELLIPRLSEGRYVLSVSVEPAGGAELRSARVVKVREP